MPLFLSAINYGVILTSKMRLHVVVNYGSLLSSLTIYTHFTTLINIPFLMWLTCGLARWKVKINKKKKKDMYIYA